MESADSSGPYLEVTPEGTFSIDENGNRFLLDGPPGPKIITFEELLASREAVIQKENTDRSNLITFLALPEGNLRAGLLRWCSIGFPDCFELFSITIQPPIQCSDGIFRETFPYIEYLLGNPLSNSIEALMKRVSGFHFSYSTPGNQLKIHVSKG